MAEQEKKRKFGKVPAFVAAMSLGANDLRVYIALASYADKQGICWPSVQHISEATGIALRGVKRATNNLEKAGLLVKKSSRGRGRPSLYVLVMNIPKKGSRMTPKKQEKRCQSGAPQNDTKKVSPTGPAIEQTSITTTGRYYSIAAGDENFPLAEAADAKPSNVVPFCQGGAA